MTNLTKLKELAERASSGDWSFSPCVADKHFLGQVWSGSDESLCIMDHMTEQANADGAFIAAANPQAILGLISRLDGLLEQHGRDSAELRALCQGRDDARKERDRLKAEVERLRKVEALQKQVNEHYKRWYRECIDEPFDTWLKDDATHWIGEQDAAFQAWQYLHENKIWLMKERIEEHEQERDRLKAENEALKDKLSDCAISLHGEMMQKYGGQSPEDMHPVKRRDYERDIAEVAEYTAALEGGGRKNPA